MKLYEISLQIYIPTLILKCEPKNGLSYRRQVVHPPLQTPQAWNTPADYP